MGRAVIVRAPKTHMHDEQISFKLLALHCRPKKTKDRYVMKVLAAYADHFFSADLNLPVTAFHSGTSNEQKSRNATPKDVLRQYNSFAVYIKNVL